MWPYCPPRHRACDYGFVADYRVALEGWTLELDSVGTVRTTWRLSVRYSS